MNNKKFFIYKNDLKFNNDFNLENSEWESDAVKDIYNDFKKKPKIEMRIKDSQMEKYEYLDLSNLDLTDELLADLFKLTKIKSILNRICFLDLSNNNLKEFPYLNCFTNIIYLNIGHNQIVGMINNDNIKELSCEYNKIISIQSNSIIKLSASNNLIKYINVPNISVLVINNNLLEKIGEYKNLEYMECINNKICKIVNLFKLQELYISNNNLIELEGLYNLLILNCTKNPIKKINHFEKLKAIISSTPIISSKYKIGNISKSKDNYLIDLE